MTIRLELTDHAREQIADRFSPPDAHAWAERQFGIGIVVGYTRLGRVVYETPEALLVIAFRRGHAPAVVTVMPHDWPVQIVGRTYEWKGDNVPATPGALRRLVERFRA
jgi:hypothetical protein